MLFTEMMEGFDVEEMFEETAEDFDGEFDTFFENGDGGEDS
jgi:sporulation-control protein